MESFQAEQKMKKLLELIGQQGASDLHLGVSRYPTLRIDGNLIPIAEEALLTPGDTVALANALMTPEQQAEFIENRELDFSYNFADKARFRVNVFMQRGYVSVTMRFVSSEIRSLEELNMPTSLYDFASFSQGLVLVVGPVGHGKSTTLAALIDRINHTQDRHIITIEDPIEYVYTQDRCIINQREIGSDSKSFSQALRSAFREDANVLLLGELRDLDTIATAMTAAETGHLVFATLHTNDTAQTIDRITDVFPSHQQNQIKAQMANVLLGVISQRLLPIIGGGRIPAVEIMIKNRAISTLIREGKSFQIDSVIETNLREGMVSLDRSLADLVQRNIVDINETYRYVKNMDYYRMILGEKE
ncbi:MAG: PilT/PilU family type 4a pilus ATPase [Candidatus Moraniibacteriota bacterium]